MIEREVAHHEPRAERSSFVLALVGTLACAMAATPVNNPSEESVAADNLANVVVADGVSREEAEAIASYFFYHHAGVGCGAPDLIREDGEKWRVSTKLDFAGDPGEDILIGKKDGSITWGRRHCVDDPLSMLLPGRPSSCAD